MSDASLSEIDLENKMTWVSTILINPPYGGVSVLGLPLSVYP